MIDGSGAMADYEYDYYYGYTPPWYKNRLNISYVTMHDGVTSIGGYAFYANTKLEAVSIPETVKTIGNYAFYNCTYLVNVTIPESVTSIGNYAFYGCNRLTSMTIPGSVTSIGIYAFSYCSRLTSVTIIEGVTSIGNWVFSDCSGLTSVTIPESVTSIGSDAFRGCSSLTAIYITSLETWYGNNFGYYFPASFNLFLNDALVTEIVIPESVTSIGNYAFRNCSSLTSVTIPESVTSIGNYAFQNCSSLRSVTIPDSVTRIRDYAFSGCSSLTSVTIPERVTSIGDYAFSGCGQLKSVTIPGSLRIIGDYAFRNCTALADVYYGGSEAQWKNISIGNNNGPLTNATLHYGLIPEIYTISYDSNGGKDAPASQQKTQNIPLTLSDIRPTHENSSAGTYSVRLTPNDGGQSSSILRTARTTTYSFKGWNTAADGSGTDYVPGASYTADADVTLYAQWESTTKTAPVTLPELARDDAVFKGWAESRDAESGVMGEYTPTGNVTLYAVWHRADLVLPASLHTVESEAFTGGAFTYVFIPETVARIDGNAFAFCPKLAYAQFAGADTVIDPAAFDGVTGLTIIAPGGSTAETFAAAHGFDFLPAA